ncbi:transposase Tn5 [Rickettsia akari str. Hartford]|uniref:Transposase Tn5 n=1 Tax=Rickettsia akari (strain Hartford) TaxID=293614 RepID=A8GNZ8_RICAH|nr:transposase Tn5 [Rickettsia akari str. Hartford]
MSYSPCLGAMQINIPARDNKAKRTVVLEVKFSNFVLYPPKNHVKSIIRK